MINRWKNWIGLVLGVAALATADAAINVTVSGPAGSAQQALPDAGGSFDVNLPLSANALNEITVTATDARTNVISKTIKIAQLSLQSIVVSQIRTTPLSVQQIEQLVNDGVIQLDNPANFNVSQFAIVLTIGGQEIPIEIPVVMSGVVEETGNEDTPPLSDPGRGSSNPSVPDVTIIQEFVSVPGPAGPEPLTIPAILVIEGRIKSLKEFYSVRMLLMNISGIFTLGDVTALISFPDGGLSTTLPADGLADFGDILPGNGDVPGQKEREFIIRGDEIGVRRVQVDFGGVVTGPGIPEDSPVPFNGSALSDVDVKGPPSFLVEVSHPDAVTAFVPYELEVKITNAGQAPALYTTFDLGVGFAGEIIDCTLDPVTTNSICTNTPGPVTRQLGHIFPGQTVSQKFTINPFATGPISSCLGISDQNINLQVNVGTIGCLTGHFPPTRGVPDGIPTVAVVPGNNQLGVSVTAPVAAFFSENMRTTSIDSASFEVFTGVDEPVPGELHFQSILGRTVAIWQPLAGVLSDNTDYRVFLSQAITDPDGHPLFNEWSSSFRTTSSINDVDPPELSLTILPPADANLVLPGQVIPIRAYAADQGSGLAHVELYAKDLNVSTGLFEHIDDKTIFSSEDLPVTFSVDSAKLVPGHSYLFKGSAFDRRGNVQDATIAAIIAVSADPPVIVMPEDPTNDVLYGVSVPLAPVALTGGVRTVAYFLDGSTNAFATMFVPPYQTSLSTFQLELTSHVVRAVATDGLGQTGEDFLAFNLITNASEPFVAFIVPLAGALYLTNETIVVSGIATDLVGIASVRFFLDSLAGPVLSTNTQPFSIAATNLAPGPHEVIMLVTNNLGTANNTAAPASRRAFSVVTTPPGPPPPAPAVTNITDPDAGEAIVGGTSVASARITIVNTNQGLTMVVDASAAGQFAGAVAANGGDVLELTAQQLSLSPFFSATTTVVVPVPPLVTNLVLTPPNRLFTAGGQFDDFTVTAQLLGGGTSNVTSRSTFSSSEPGVASVNQSGRMVANAAGTATLTATFKTNVANALITADIVTVTNFTVSPTSMTLRFPTDIREISVTGQFSNGSSAPLGGASFGAADPLVAIVNGAGFVTAVGDGATLIAVGCSNLPPRSVAVTVDNNLNPPPVTQIISPANGTPVERNQFLVVNVQAADPTGGVVRTEFRTTGALVSSNGAGYGPTALDLRGFNITVPSNAAMGGVISVDAWAVDVGAKTSATASITLNVADLTAPSVSILTPTNEQPFNDGFTVTVTVASSDAVGVERVRYETSGALALSGMLTNPLPQAATNVFTFIVPPGAVSPDVYVTAFARDAAGNERTSTPVHIMLTGADITPPETIITAASAPGSSASNLLSYSVTAGFADLKQVQIYFRRNGIGTFNLYTETSGTNILGRFLPQSGTNGSVVFNSTQMGGDGTYEFYSVGVDLAGNRELPPTNADQTAVFNAGTVWVSVNASTNLAALDMSLDNQNLRVSNAVVTIEGAHTFRNVELLGTSRIAHAAATTTNEPAFNFTAWTLAIASNAAVDVTGRGYLGGFQGDNGVSRGRTTNNALGSTARSAGSYGGIGGIVEGTPNALYGSVVTPIDLGSGGSSDGGSFWTGGNGGGRIALNVINVAGDGPIRANGNNNTGNSSGSGSGGSVYIITRTLSGNGWVEANGGANEVGGGGGRVAIHYVDLSTKALGQIRAIGGDGGVADGGNGTVFLLGFGSSNGTLVVDGQGVASPFSSLPIPVGFTFDNIIIRNNARAIVDDPIVVNDSLQILTGSVLTHSVGQTNGLRIGAARVFVDATSTIDASGKGYRGGRRDGNGSNRGETLGAQLGAQTRSGGSYGGLGGIVDGPGSNLVYGTPYDAIHLGAGGSSDGGSFWVGGNGGGRVTITATDRVTIHGSVQAEGQSGSGNLAGSGAGGSIKITTGLLEGSGFVSANGGGYENGGGGGRVVVNHSFLGSGTNDLGGLRNVTAAGGKGGTRHGSAGTVLFKQASQTYGDLYVDATTTNATALVWSPLTPIGLGKSAGLTTNTLTLDGAVAVLPGGLVGLKLRPNVNHPAEFTITGNTETTITVQVVGGTNLTDVAGVGSVYAAQYRFDQVTLRRGAWWVTSDKVVVNGTMSATENSVVTHFDATTVYEPGLDVTANSIVIASNSAINVDGRGYLGGRQGDNGLNEGRTTNNAAGATARSAGSYGGLGGRVDGTANPIYGDLKNPVELGSGGSSDGGSSWRGGDGGGRVRLAAASVMVEGLISANGSPNVGNSSGSGSGGSVLLNVGTLSGLGTVRANGGANETGAGGGRVAVNYTTLWLASSQIQARGGDGSSADGGHGTVFLKSATQTDGELIVDGGNQSSPFDSVVLPAGYTFDDITFRNQAYVLADSPITVSDTLRVLAGSRISHTRGVESGVVINVAKLIVDATSTIDASGKGYRGGRRDGNGSNRGETLGAQLGAQTRSGGSYGGLGGIVDGPGSNLVYGTPYDAIHLGAGGSSDGGSFWVGGNGGGRVTITATDRVTIHGSVQAEGQSGSGNLAGSGAGGSIKITTGLLEGSGFVSANGGGYENGGGGGRVVVNHSFLGSGTNDLGGLRNVTAAGGKGGTRHGSAGTVLFKQASQTYGDLYVDATTTNATALVWSPLTPIGLGKSAGLTTNTLTLDGAVAVLPGGLVGLKLRPNVNHPAEFTITGNTETTITVQVVGGTNLTDVAGVGSVYAAQYRFDQVTLRRGAWWVTSDKVVVNGTMSATENSVVTHFDATTVYEPGLDVTANSIVIASNSAINVDGRGYLGGRQGDNGLNEGRTTNNAAGATARSAGSYGGLGGRVDGTANPIYGDLKNPVELGSGGSSDGGSSWRGGDGGGRVRLAAASVMVEGLISANGSPNVGNSSGSGSGGSVLLNVGTLSGLGTVRANGGANETGAGGGRVAVNYTTLWLASSQIQARGGDGSSADGGHGTIFFKSTSQTNGDLIVDGYGFATASDSTLIPSNIVFDSVMFRNGARVQLAGPLVVLGSVQITSNTVLTHPLSWEPGLRIEAGSLWIDTNSAIDVSARGYRGGQRDGNASNIGLTTNGTPGSTVRAGGSYGGLGGVSGGVATPTYGVATNPVFLGSGGSSDGGSFWIGGNGGGRITLVISGLLTNGGAIRANGGVGAGNGAGGGAGGSVKISAGTFAGIGTIEAKGGGNETGGGGGRIAVFYGTLNYNTNLATASGGSGSAPGALGTVYFAAGGGGGGQFVAEVRVEGMSIEDGRVRLYWRPTAMRVRVQSADRPGGTNWCDRCPPGTNATWLAEPTTNAIQFFRLGLEP